MDCTAWDRADWYWASRTTYTILTTVRPRTSAGVTRRDSGSVDVNRPPPPPEKKKKREEWWR